MNTGPGPNSGDRGLERTAARDDRHKQQDRHDGGFILFCTSCGARLENESPAPVCPICLVRFTLPVVNALPQGQASKDPIATASESKGMAAPSGRSQHIFAHYKLEIGPDGKPVQLGHGAMGVTYKALDTLLLRPVALKVIASRFLENESLKTRFVREARAAASLRHPNIASVFYLGSNESSYFYVMELVEGRTLEDIIAARHPPDVSLALEIATQVASALAAAHQAGLVHRDLKPANLIVSLDERNRPTVKLIDFGLVKLTAEVSGDASVSEPGVFMGTPRYASPEQFIGGRVDIRSDLYALGVVLWEMLAKTTPFTGSTAQVAGQHLQAPLPMSQVKNLPLPVVSLLSHLLKKDPGDRPQTPEELLTILKETIRTLSGPQANLRLEKPRTPSVRTQRSRRAPGLGEDVGRKLKLEPWDFTPLLAEKIKGFTGREWLFQEIDAWRAQDSSSVLLIAGEPGVGKSAIVAALVDRNPGGQVLGYHCCRADTPATLEPAGFVRSLVAMFAARLEDYAALMGGFFIAETIRRADTDPISAFEAAILGPLHKIKTPPGGRFYLLIDSLDEALTRIHPPTIVDALSTRLDRFPSWLGIVATTRNDPGVLSQLGGLRAHVLSAQDPRNQDDVRRFIRYRLSQPVLRDQLRGCAKMLTGLEKDLLRSSAGNFLFVSTALNALESGQLSFDQIENLPPGLSSLYKIFFHRLFRDAGVDFGVSRRVLESMAAARESLNREQIAAASGLDAEDDIPLVLSRLASFVPGSEGRYAFFHKSLSDWLTGWDNQQDQPFAGPYHVSLQKGSARLANWCWAEYQRGSLNLSSYCLRHLPAHLNQVGREEALHSVLSDFNFLQRKLDLTDARTLIADYEYLPLGAPLRLVHSAVRLSAHVLARDKRQLAGQLTGRLLGNPAPVIQGLLQGAAEGKTGAWLQPSTPSLAPPGGAMIRTFEGHTAWVHAVVLTPDGNSAISGSWDGTLRVWDLESGQSVRTLKGHAGWVYSVAITPDGKRVISASSDRTLRVWDLEKGQSVCIFQDHKDRVNSVAITPDGKRVISASSDRTLRLWDLEKGRLVRTFQGHLDAINSVAITPDGKRALSASSDRTLRVWDLEKGRLVRTLEGHLDAVNVVVPMPDGHRAISGSADHSMSVWDLENGQLVCTFEGHTHSVTAVVLMPDERHALSGSADHTLRMWDLEKGQLVRTFEGHTDWVTSVAVTADRRRAISGSADRTLRMWDLEGGQTGRKLAGHADSVTAVGLMPDGRPAAFVSDYQVLRVWDLESGQLRCVLEGHADWVTSVALTLDGRRAVSASADQTLRVWDLKSGQSVHTLVGHTDLISAVAVTPDGRHAISASADQTLRLWDLESGQSMRTLASHSPLVSSLAVTPDGRCAVWGSNTGALLVWGSGSGEVVRILAGHQDWVTAVGITHDGSRAISASADHTLRIWDLESGQPVLTLTGHTGLVNAVALTPEGRCAISASTDYTLRVWDIQSGISIAAFTGESPMLRCALAPDGRTIIAREKSGRAHFLRLKGLD
jgi:WD40 repeat protein/serine/threonine protein kinase